MRSEFFLSVKCRDFYCDMKIKMILKKTKSPSVDLFEVYVKAQFDFKNNLVFKGPSLSRVCTSLVI